MAVLVLNSGASSVKRFTITFINNALNLLGSNVISFFSISPLAQLIYRLKAL